MAHRAIRTITLILGCVVGVTLGACEDPFDGDSGDSGPRGCGDVGESCNEICAPSSCTLTEKCEGIAVAYDDRASCEAGEPGVGTVLAEHDCESSFGPSTEGKFIACCCETPP